jgi:hypothetical protein
VVGDRPAHDHPAEHVEHGGAVGPAVSGGVLGDVDDPQPVGGVGDEPALHQGGVHRRQRPGAAVLAPVADPASPAVRISRATRLRPNASPRPQAQFGADRGAP